MKLLKNSTLVVCVLAISLSTPSASAQTGTAGAPDVSKLKYGLYIHYGIATFAHPGEQGQIPVDRFDPTNVDVASWARTAKAAGMTFAVLTAKHESGFCLWDSAGYNYDIAKSPYKGDIIGNFITACNAEGIIPGLHYSVTDHLNEGPSGGRGLVSADYFELIKKHLIELNTLYPGIRILILDGIGRLSHEQFVAVSLLMKQVNPQCVLLNNSDQEDRGPRDAGATTIKGWFWQPGVPLVPASQLFDRYNQAMAVGQIYILGVGPEPSGQIPDEQLAAVMRVTELKNEANTPVTADSLKRGLILDYDFDQPPVGDRIPDLSGSGNDGMAVGVQWVADGHRGGSAQFGMTNSYITVRNNASVNPAELTLCAWIKTSYTDAIWRRIFDKATSVGYDLTMCGNQMNGRSTWQGQFALETGKQWAPSGVNVDDGLWHQVAGTFDGNELQVYVDGQAVGRPRPANGPPAHTAYDLTIGANRSNPNVAIGEVGPSFYGMMDDVMMYNRALTPREVTALYYTQKTATDVALAIPAPGRRNPSPNPPPQNRPSAADRLRQVKALYDQGLITKDQYDQKVQQIMNSL